MPWMPDWATSVGVSSSVMPMKPTLTPLTLVTQVPREDVRPVALADDVGGQPREVGAGVAAGAPGS